jgi:hypothetical protein
MREILGQVRIERTGLGGVRELLEKANTVFKAELAEVTTWWWIANAATPYLYPIGWPWRAHPAIAAGGALTSPVRHSFLGNDASYGYPGYGLATTLSSSVDMGRMRTVNASAVSMAQGYEPFVFSGIGIGHNQYRSLNFNSFWGHNNMISLTDLGIQQIGVPYLHPVAGCTVTTSVGLSYVTLPTQTLSTINFGGIYTHPHLLTILRIETGADRGQYYVQHFDRPNGRFYLQTMTGQKFVAQASNTGIAGTMSQRPAFFNETGVLWASAGRVDVDGYFDPGEARNSYLFKVHFEKSGSPSPSNEAQRGTYWFSMRPWIWGSGNYDAAQNYGSEDNGSASNRLVYGSVTTEGGFHFNVSGGVTTSSICTGMGLDKVTQRLWLAHGDKTNTGSPASIGYWNYKSPETMREVATSVGTPNDPLPTPFAIPVDSVPCGCEIGSDGTAYFPLYHTTDNTKNGVLAIKRDLSYVFLTGATMGTTGGYAPTGLVVDKTRFRSGTAGDATSTAAGHITSATGTFAAQDVGRCITLTGNTQDNGTYLISVINSGTDVTVTTLAGAAVSFTGGSGGTYSIGDRIYMFTSTDTAWNANKMSFLDSLSLTQRFTKTVTMTNGTTIPTYYLGSVPAACVDPLNGNVFWYSNDTAGRLNKFVVETGAVEQRPLTDFAVQVPGSNANPTAPTVAYSVAVNTNTYFRELWVGTDQGQFKFNPDTFSAQLYRYFGTTNAGTYAKADGKLSLDGTDSGTGYTTTPKVRQFLFAPDGQVYCSLMQTAINNYSHLVHLSREMDCFEIGAFSTVEYPGQWSGTYPNVPTMLYFMDGYGGFVWYLPTRNAGASAPGMVVAHLGAIHYQWTGSAWVAREVVRNSIPDSTSSPGCLTRPLHTGLEDLIYGVKIKFTRQAGVGGENTDFIGRIGQLGVAKTDGGTTSGAGSFTGSGFSSLSFITSDKGRYYLRIEGGADAGVYIISAVTNDTLLTLQKFNGAALTANATAGTLQYTIWDIGAGSAVGPENCTFTACTGYAKDNTQDITGLLYEAYLAKTLLSEQEESIKFAMDPVPVVGSGTVQVFTESYAAANPNFSAAKPAHLALPGSPATDGTHLLDGCVAKVLDGTGSRANISVPGSMIGGTVVSSAAWSGTVDAGSDVEVGSITIRARSNASNNVAQWMYPLTAGGLLGLLLSAPNSGGTPAASTSVRTSGSSNITATSGSSTISVSSGDFLGSSVASGSDGETNPGTYGVNVFVSAAGGFTGHAGKALKITSGADAGSYRIVSVNGDGSQATIRNLDQTAKTFSAAATGLSFAVHDSVTEEDLICIPSLAVPTYQYVVERLLTTTTAQIRHVPGSTSTNQNWQCVRPTWSVVKRLSYSGTATPPDVANNGTFISLDGKENYGQRTLFSAQYFWNSEVKIVFDLSDLPSAARTARWWKFAATGRFTSLGSANPITSVDSIELLDTNGKRLFMTDYTRVDAVTSQPNFLSAMVNRLDFIQSKQSAASQYAWANGTAILGGTAGDTITLTGGNKFLGFQVRPKGTNGTSNGTSTFTAGGGDPPFLTSDVGRFLVIASGVNNNSVFRISSYVSGTQVTVTTPAGNAATIGADTAVSFTVHEGINAGGTVPDYIVLMAGANQAGLTEMSILTISDDLTTITVSEKQWRSASGQNWEIRRRAIENRTSSTGVDAANVARLLFAELLYPQQSGDVSQDMKGYVKFWPADVGGTNLTAGVTVAGGNHFQAAASIFTADDVGRVIVITGGTANKGSYKIATIVSGTEVTLVNAFTGASPTFTNESSLTYTIKGERRHRFSRYTTALRQ